MSVDTKAVTGRRALKFTSLDDIRRDLDAVEQANRDGRCVTVGNWTPGMIFDHIAATVKYSIDGFPFGPTLLTRLFGPLIRKKMLNGWMPAGVKLPPKAREPLLPKAGVSFEQGLSTLRAQLDREKAGQRMTAFSPLLGKMTHEDWVRLHCVHGGHHLSFITISGMPRG